MVRGFDWDSLGVKIVKLPRVSRPARLVEASDELLEAISRHPGGASSDREDMDLDERLNLYPDDIEEI